MLIYYFSCLYFFCFVTVKDDETEKKRRGKKSEIEFFILKRFGKNGHRGIPTEGEFHSLKLFLSFHHRTNATSAVNFHKSKLGSF